MASIAEPATRRDPFAPDLFERILAIAATILLAAVIAALAKGYREWPLVPWQVWPHLVTVMAALALTPVMLLRRRGDPLHRALGRAWAASMVLTASLSFNLREINDGQFSIIHLLAVWTLIQAPLIWWSAHTHRVATHRRAVRGMVTGALLIAGFFTFPFNRLLGHWLFG
jgi:uncharacterized membrane protein